MTFRTRNPGARPAMLSRRDFLEHAQALGVGAVGSTLASSLVFPLDARAADLALTMFIWSGGEQGTVAREVVGEFVAENPNVGIEFYESSNTVTYPKMVAAKQANPEAPLVNFGYFNVDVTNKGDRDDMWLSLDPERMPNMADIYPEYHRPEDKGIGHSVSPIGIAYNPQFVKEPPTSWADVWSNRAYKGRVVLFDYLWPYTGVVQAARMNGGDEANPDVGFEIWAENAEQILALVTSTQQGQNLIARGDAWVTIWAKGNIQQWKDAGVPVEYVVPEEGVVAFPLYFQVVTGTTPEQKAVAERILNILLEPGQLARFCELNGLAPASAKVQLPERMATDPAYQPETIQNAMQLDWATLAARDAAYRDKWDRMVKTRL